MPVLDACYDKQAYRYHHLITDHKKLIAYRRIKLDLVFMNMIKLISGEVKLT